MLKLNTERSGKWYAGVDFENSHVVTDKNHNTDLGIEGIILKAPTTTGKNGRVFASVVIRFINGMSVFGSLYVDKALDGLTFGVDTRQTDNGPVDINVKVPMAIQAQVIRYALTKAITVAGGPVVETPAQSAPAQQQYQAPAQPQYQAPAQPAQPATGLSFDSLTPEMLAMLQQSQANGADALAAQLNNLG